jgi:2-phospho-L-lactate guanylyltransferase
MAAQENVRWWVIVPMKDTRRAKSRLGGKPGERRQLAIVMARDTLCAVVNATAVAGVLVICDTAEDIESFDLPGVRVRVADRPGLNEAIRYGAEQLRSADSERDLAVLPGDLPYLRSSELDNALHRASAIPLACVGDQLGTGTTLLTARAGHLLQPSYGVGSLQAHRAAGAVEIDLASWSGLRRDVDQPGDLRIDAALNARTRSVLTRRGEDSGLLASGRR